MEKYILEQLIEYIHKDNCIIFAYLFGSCAKGKDKDTSDIDIAVFLDNILKDNEFDYKIKIKLELEDILRKPLDVVILNSAPPLLKHQVFKYGKLLKCSNKNTVNEFKIRSFYEYCDISNIMSITLEANKKRINSEVSNGR